MNKIVSWKKSKLSKNIYINKHNMSKKNHFDNIIYLDTGSITENHINYLQNFTIDNLPNRAKRMLPKESIVYSTVRPIQKHFGFLNNKPTNFIVSTGFAVIESKKYSDILLKFIYYFLTTNKQINFLQTLAENSTSAYPSIRPSDIKNLIIYFPPIEEQNKIIHILDSINNMIELNNKIISKLESMAKTIYDYWFTQFDFPNDDNKPYKKSGGKMIYCKELGRYIPKGWEILKLNERFCFEKGIEIGAKNYSDIKLDNYIPFYRVGDLNSHCNTYTKKSLLGEKILQNNDVCVSFDGTVGKVDIGLYGGYSSGIRKIYDKNNIISNAEIYFIFKSDYIQKIINKYATGSNILHSSESINNMYIAYNEKIYKIYRQLIIPLFNNILKCKEENQKLSEIRDFLLPLLMNGQAYIE